MSFLNASFLHSVEHHYRTKVNKLYLKHYIRVELKK